MHGVQQKGAGLRPAPKDRREESAIAVMFARKADPSLRSGWHGYQFGRDARRCGADIVASWGAASSAPTV